MPETIEIIGAILNSSLCFSFQYFLFLPFPPFLFHFLVIYPFNQNILIDHLGIRHCEQLIIITNMNKYEGPLLPPKVEQAHCSLYLVSITEKLWANT